MAARKIPERVCVLVGRQQSEDAAGGECRNRMHGHLSGSKAQQLVENGNADWQQEVWKDVRGREHRRTLPVIRLTGRKVWKGRLSDHQSGAPMKVMQLVAN